MSVREANSCFYPFGNAKLLIWDVEKMVRPGDLTEKQRQKGIQKETAEGLVKYTKEETKGSNKNNEQEQH